MTASAGPSRMQRRVLAVLCGTEIVGYGVLFYAFPVLAAGITADTGWSTGTITATAVGDRWGDAHYGRLSGLVAAPTTLATALAPWAGAAAEALGGYPVVFGLLAGIAVVAAVLAAWSVPAGSGALRSGSRPARAR